METNVPAERAGNSNRGWSHAQSQLRPESQVEMIEDDPVLDKYRYKWRKVALGVLFLALIVVIFRALAAWDDTSPAAAPTTTSTR